MPNYFIFKIIAFSSHTTNRDCCIKIINGKPPMRMSVLIQHSYVY